MFTRVFVIVLDSVGIGELPDAHEYGDSNVNTLANIARLQGGLFLPNLQKLGLGCIEDITGVPAITTPSACYGKMAEISKAKDTTSGHWEIAGCPVFKPFPVYPDGFPQEVIESFIFHTGRHILGNKPASGTEIIKELGAEHIKTGKPIVYTSADSVFQIAAHEDIIPLPDLYEICKIVREKVCTGRHAVGRVIARPFIGNPGNFNRTANRHDYSVLPPSPTVLDHLKQSGYSVIGIGKIGDIFAQQGLTESHSTKSNLQGMELLKDLADQECSGLIIANLVEFDSLYGHRNDIPGYAKALEEFDLQLGLFLPRLKESDLLIITADHGCDPTSSGTDHTREYVPLLAFSPKNNAVNLGLRTTFADIAATIAENFHLAAMEFGQSFLIDVREFI